MQKWERTRRGLWRAVLAGAAVALGLAAGFALARSWAARGDAPLRAHPFFPVARGAPEVVAHRGGLAEGPENTLEAFRRALAGGADILEMDVRASADGALVVIHDPTVDRTTDGTGRVDALPLAALRALDAAHHFSPDGARTPLRGRGVRIPTLTEVFHALPAARIAVEIKPTAAGALAERMCDTIRAAGAEQRTLVASFVEAEVLAFRAACPEVATAATLAEGFRFWLLRALAAGATPPDALIVPRRVGPLRVATPAFSEAARRRGLPVQSWLANDWREVAALRDAGLDALLTDHPARVSRWLRDR